MTAEKILESYGEGKRGQERVLAFLYNSLRDSVVNYARTRGLSTEEGHDCLVEGILVLDAILLNPAKRAPLAEKLDMNSGLERLVFYFCKLEIFKMAKQNKRAVSQVPFEEVPAEAVMLEPFAPLKGEELDRIKGYLRKFGEECVKIVCYRVLDNFTYAMIKDRLDLKMTVQGVKRRFESCLMKARQALGTGDQSPWQMGGLR